MDIEVSCMQMILHSGNARGNAYEAIDEIKKKNFDHAVSLLDDEKQELLLSQKTHAQLLREMASQNDVPANLLLIHAEDHVASSEVVCDMAKELFAVYEILAKRKEY